MKKEKKNLQENSDQKNPNAIDRRSFLKTGALMGAAMCVPPVLGSMVSCKSPKTTDNSNKTPLLVTQNRVLGSGNAAFEVSAISFGCMGLNYHRSAHPDKKAAIRLLHEAVDMGVTLFDTAESYGPWINEELVGEALYEYRNKVNITTKFGHTFVDGKHNIGVEDCSPENIRRVCEASLKRLRIDSIPMFYQHRQDKNVPVEVVAETVKELIKEGKVQRFGLSEVNAETIRRAHAVCPVTAVQSEYHLMWREPEYNIFSTLEELGIGFVAYSPVNRGFLGGELNEFTRFDPENDNRAFHNRFTPEALRANTPIVEELHRFGRTRGITSAQAALAWMMAKKPWIVPIPGTTKLAHLIEDLQSIELSYTAEEWTTLEQAVNSHPITGNRGNSRDTSIQS